MKPRTGDVLSWDNVTEPLQPTYSLSQVYDKLTQRNLGVYNKIEQKKIRAASVAIIGVGCDGGMDAYILARMGVGKLVLVDFDVNELSNLNRQPMSTFSTLGLPKVLAAKAILHDMNPLVKVEAVNKAVEEDNAEKIVKKADVVLQCTDSMVARIVTVRACIKAKKPCIVMTGQPPFRSFVSTILSPGPSYEELFNIGFVKGKLFKGNPKLVGKVRGLKRERALHANKLRASEGWLQKYLMAEAGWGITPERAYLTSVYQVHEALALITGRSPKAVAPRAFVSDLNGLSEFGRPDVIAALLDPPNGRWWDYRMF
ncbi:SAMP-activating enzyme E1 [uncultured archaeon]|nr:SAMP-activating enzyme E1 [uncultured archaeon]